MSITARITPRLHETDVSSPRGRGVDPTITASASSGSTGFIRAAFGMRPVVFSVLVIVTYFVSTVGGDGSEGWSLRSFFSSFLAFFSISLFRFSN